MTRWLVFAGESFYPAGGLNDYCGAFDTEEDARRFIAEKIERNPWLDWWQLVEVQEDGLPRLQATKGHPYRSMGAGIVQRLRESMERAGDQPA